MDNLTPEQRRKNMQHIKAQDTINDLEFFFGILKENDAKLIGGKLPNKELYYK